MLQPTHLNHHFRPVALLSLLRHSIGNNLHDQVLDY